MNAFAITATILFTILFFVWTKKDWANFSIKMIFFGCSIWGAFLVASAYGFIIKV